MNHKVNKPFYPIIVSAEKGYIGMNEDKKVYENATQELLKDNIYENLVHNCEMGSSYQVDHNIGVMNIASLVCVLFEIDTVDIYLSTHLKIKVKD